MKPVQIGAAIVSVLGLGAVVAAFLINASPYVSIQEARTTDRKSVHVAGDIIKGTMKVLPTKGYVTFGVKDKAGDQIDVVYRGAPPGNMGTATQVVAVGGVKEGVFQADRIVLKCPSKYEAEKEKGHPQGIPMGGEARIPSAS